jgi:hypothetical protein
MGNFFSDEFNCVAFCPFVNDSQDIAARPGLGYINVVYYTLDRPAFSSQPEDQIGTRIMIWARAYLRVPDLVSP